MGVLLIGPKEGPDFNLQYRFMEAIGAADDPRYVADMLLSYYSSYGNGLDPGVAVDVDLASHAERTFREWRPGRGLRRWQPSEVVHTLAIQRARHSSQPVRPGGAR